MSGKASHSAPDVLGPFLQLVEHQPPARMRQRLGRLSTPVGVSEIVKDEKIVMQWSDPPTAVVWTFTAMPENATFVEVCNFGFACALPTSR